MQEAILHYIWKFKAFNGLNLATTQQLSLTILSVGSHNINNSGPDFSNAKLEIDGQLWAGNVEIHNKASDWYLHNHENDKTYDNVILHVVWEDDAEVFRKNRTIIPTLQLKDLVSEHLINSTKSLLERNTVKWIPCQNQFHTVDAFTLNNWQDRLYIERLTKKSKTTEELLSASKQDWEAVLFQVLAKNFGLNTNGEYFLNAARQIPFTVLRKVRQDKTQLEALLLGSCNLLDAIEDPYAKQLLEIYRFLKVKFKLKEVSKMQPQFFRLRPSNFPTIRLAQLATLYTQEEHLFSKLIAAKTVKEIKQLFNVTPKGFWETHYSFKAQHAKKPKPITVAFKNLIIINTIIPLLFSYRKSRNEPIDYLLDWIKQLPKENNSIVKQFNTIRPKTVNNALESQSIIELKSEYCQHYKCLQCEIGNFIINHKNS